MNNAVYLHIPFCKRKCNYCDFYSAPQNPEIREQYIRALCNQIVHTAPMHVRTLYVGGGTPSVLTGEQFERIFAALHEVFTFDPDGEITVEMNPDSVTADLLQVLRCCGVNRLSMGVQSMENRELSTLGRLHSAEHAKQAVALAKAAGFSNISLDLMLAIPGQTAETLTQNLREILALGVPHISVYLLKIEENTPFFGQYSEQAEEVQEAFYMQVHNALTAHGYEHYEISNFARPGYGSRHNTNYWLGGTYRAFGPGAHGYEDGLRYCYAANLRDYLAKNGLAEREIIEEVDMQEAAKEKLLLGLRLSEGVPFAAIAPEKQDLAAQFCKLGFARTDNGRFALTAKGFLVSNTIISELL